MKIRGLKGGATRAPLFLGPFTMRKNRACWILFFILLKTQGKL